MSQQTNPSGINEAYNVVFLFELEIYDHLISEEAIKILR